MTLTADRAQAKPYGDVTYADPGYQADKKARYPIDTAEHAKAAWSYINQASSAAQYSSEDLAKVKARIMAACKKFGVQIAEAPAGRARNLGVCVRAFDFEAADGDGRTLEGHAAVFNVTSRIRDLHGDFDEVIRPGAFARTIRERMPVLQFDHGKDPRVGHVPIGAIQDLREDGTGLYVRARLFDNLVVEPVRQAIEGKAIRGMSFRFSVPENGEKWTTRQRDVELREVLDVDAPELGPVVFPAYDSTDVGVRSMLATLDPDELRALIRELAAEVRLAVDLDDFTGRPARGAGGGEFDAEPQDADAPPVPLSVRFAGDDDALRIRRMK